MSEKCKRKQWIIITLAVGHVRKVQILLTYTIQYTTGEFLIEV